MSALTALPGLRILEAPVRGILTRTSGFIREAGFTHSLTPARNCSYGCSYCYVPTMGIYGGLKPDDVRHWGEFTTFKSNAADLLRRELKAGQSIYCSPLVDPYQPAEEQQRSIPEILKIVSEHAPRCFTIQTRGPGILRDLDLLVELSKRTHLRVSFSVTTDREEVRRRYEPHCARFETRLDVIRTLRAAGVEVYATLAPLLPCDAEALTLACIEASGRDLIGDPLHVRTAKPRGATTREAAHRIADRFGELNWFDPQFQTAMVERIETVAATQGKSFRCGPPGFAMLAR